MKKENIPKVLHDRPVVVSLEIFQNVGLGFEKCPTPHLHWMSRTCWHCGATRQHKIEMQYSSISNDIHIQDIPINKIMISMRLIC